VKVQISSKKLFCKSPKPGTLTADTSNTPTELQKGNTKGQQQKAQFANVLAEALLQVTKAGHLDGGYLEHAYWYTEGEIIRSTIKSAVGGWKKIASGFVPGRFSCRRYLVFRLCG
jgi:hypothetical protein